MDKKKQPVSPNLVRHESERETKELPQFNAHVRPNYAVVVNTDRKYTEVSDSFCKLLGYTREELIGKKYDEITAPRTNDIPIVFELFMRSGYMHGIWIFVHRSGTRILVRYEAWLRPDSQIEGHMELLGAGA
jgi:PAS domain S-box-containing protein